MRHYYYYYYYFSYIRPVFIIYGNYQLSHDFKGMMNSLSYMKHKIHCSRLTITDATAVENDCGFSSFTNNRPRRSRGYHTRHWIQGSRVQTLPGSMDFFQSVKILSMTSFGREVKSWGPCRRFTARKRTSSRN